MGTCEYVLQNISAPESKTVKSVLMGTVLRIGDVSSRSDEALELSVKASKATAIARPKSWKKFVLRTKDTAPDDMTIDDEIEDNDERTVYTQLKMRTEYYIDRNAAEANEEDEDGDVKMKGEDDDAMLLDAAQDDEDAKEKATHLEKVEKEDLVRGFKYGTTYAPCPDGQFPKLDTHKGIDICGFFPIENVCHVPFHWNMFANDDISSVVN
jgi:ATP-dependent DNA helicase 2 subunit 2